jgi:cytochrome c553
VFIQCNSVRWHCLLWYVFRDASRITETVTTTHSNLRCAEPVAGRWQCPPVNPLLTGMTWNDSAATVATMTTHAGASKCPLRSIGLLALLMIAAVSGLRGDDASAPAEQAAFAPEQIEFFEKKVRPVLVEHCFECHSEKKQKGGLRLDSRASAVKGGEFGPAIVPGTPEKSLLVEAVSYANEDMQMPPKKKLSDAQIQDLTAWVKLGAPWPGQHRADPAPVAAGGGKSGPLFTPEQKAFWSFQPIKERELPAVKNEGWPKNEIDRFILARLEAAGLQPAPAADKRSLIRRATFDLIGLPPTLAEIEAFVADDSPDAFAKLIDRLLASPHYGEKWGRHWLDVARYGDSNGMDVDHAMANAWRYRDYVVNAFNTDKPFDRFVHEQLAGDLLPSSDDARAESERLVATGFLSLGPKVLAELDTEKKRMDIIDEQIDTVGRAFMGLTLGCARCHDHKFDPLPTADYYSLAGIFKSTRTIEAANKRVSTWIERPLGTPAEAAKHRELSAKVTAAQEQLDQFRAKTDANVRAQARARSPEYLLAATRRVHRQKLSGATKTEPGVVVIEAEDFVSGNVRIDRTDFGKDIGVIRTTENYPDHAEYDIKVPVAGQYQLELRYASKEPRPVQLVLNGDLVTHTARGNVAGESAAGKVTGDWTPQAQQWETAGVFPFKAGANTLQIKREGPLPLLDKLLVGPPSAEPHGPRLGAADARPGGYDTRELSAEFLKGWAEALKKQHPASPLAGWQKVIAEAGEDGPTLEDARRFIARVSGTEGESGAARADEAPAFLAWLNDEKDGPFALPKDSEKLYDVAAFSELKKQREALSKLKDAVPQLPMAVAVEEGEIADQPVLVRGNHQNPAEIVPRRMLRVIAGEEQTPVGPGESGRLQLARWLTAPEHPLTSRVFVNRVWLWHFGEGLVRTPDNFGLKGDKPVLDDLLDWLALRFQHDGWSVKKLHRLIMLSSAYQMSTVVEPEVVRADPENRFVSRFRPRRLDAEEIRDAMLAVSGQLNLAIGGSIMEMKNRTYAAGGNIPKTARNLLHFDSPRRGIYLPVIRTSAYEMFDVFDFPSNGMITGQRPRTTVVLQALFMMNSDFAQTAASHLRDLLKAETDDSRRVVVAYQRALQRAPSPAEVQASLEFVERSASTLAEAGEKDPAAKSWQLFCQALLASNEFLYVN